MSRFDYKNATLMSRVETIQVYSEDFPEIIRSNDLNRVQKVCAIQKAVGDSYRNDGYRDVVVRIANGVINDLITTSKIEHRPLPDIFTFNVELVMPIVEASTVPVKLRKDCLNHLKDQFGQQEPTYYNDEWNSYHDSI